MHTTRSLLDAYKAHIGIKSDYALAEHWHVSRQRISQYASGSNTLGDERAIEIADTLGIDRSEAIIAMMAERAVRSGNMATAACLFYVLDKLFELKAPKDIDFSNLYPNRRSRDNPNSI